MEENNDIIQKIGTMVPSNNSTIESDNDDDVPMDKIDIHDKNYNTAQMSQSMHFTDDSNDYYTSDQTLDQQSDNRSEKSEQVKPPTLVQRKSSNRNRLKSGPWNYGIQLMLKKIGEKAAGYKYMHKQDQFYMEKVNNRYWIVEIVLLAILGALTSGEFVGLLADTGLRSNIIGLIIITGLQVVFIAGSGVVKNLRENGQYPTLIWQHQYMSAKFNEINLEVQEQISLNLADRASDKDFLKSVIKTYNHLMETAPSIRETTIENYINGTNSYDIYRPLIVGAFDQIEIVIDDGNDNGDDTHIRIKDNNGHMENVNHNNDDLEDKHRNRNKYLLERYLKNM